MMSATTMTCMSCGETKAWPSLFPNSMSATCWPCAWKDHLRTEHPRVVRKARKDADRRAKIRYRNEAHAEVEKELIDKFGSGGIS